MSSSPAVPYFDSLEQFEIALGQSLQRALQGAGDNASTRYRSPTNLSESIQYSLLAPGKRIRPRLALACAQMLDLPVESAQAAAFAIEMIHCFTLIHDDLPCMDDDDFRRGRPANHKKFGEAVALLAGDALIGIAMDTLLEAPAGPSLVLQAARRLSWAMGARAVIGGQAAEALLGTDSQLNQLRDMHAQKTGALFVASLMMPLDLSGISQTSPQGHAVYRFSEKLGLGFQTVDDLEDAVEEGVSPTSVLYYLPAAEAAAQAHEALRLAAEKLERQWGRKSAALQSIAQEVLNRLPRGPQ